MVYYFSNIDSVTIDNYQHMLAYLPAGRRAKAERYVRMRDQISSVLVYYLLKYALFDAYGLKTVPDISVEEGTGKPYFIESDIEFNLSHSRDCVAVVVGRGNAGQVGIDVECIQECIPGVANLAFTNREKLEVEGRDLQFIRLWTIKEAYVKYLGQGLSAPIKEYDFAGNISEDEFHKYNTYFKTKSFSSFVITVCAEEKESEFAQVEINSLLRLIENLPPKAIL